MKYPIGILTFEQIIQGGFVYVDKTEDGSAGAALKLNNKKIMPGNIPRTHAASIR